MDTTSLPPDDRPPVASPRRTNRGLLWAAALAVVVLSIATIVAFTTSSADSPEKLGGATAPPSGGLAGDTDVSGQVAPAVTYTTFDGEEVALRPAGKPMLVNFWASYCLPCLVEMPALEESYAANKDRVDFLGIDVVDDESSGVERIESTGVTYPMGRDPRGTVFAAFGGASLPRTALIAADGTIVDVHSGALTTDELQSMLDEHFGA